MGNLGKKILGAAVLGAAAGATAYYFTKKKNEDPDLQEEFADFQDNVKETAASAVNVASKFKEAVGKSVDNAVSKVKEHTDDVIDDDIFEDDDLNQAFEAAADEVKDAVKETAEHIKDASENVKEKAEDVVAKIKEEKDN